MDYLLNKFDSFLFDSYKFSDRDLSLYRIFFCSVSLVFYGFPNFLWLGDTVDYIFFPPTLSLLNLLNSFPPFGFFYLLNISIVGLHILLLFGWHSRLVSVLLSLCLIIGFSFVYSFGKIDHNIMFVITPLIMAYSGWGKCYSVDEKLGRKSENNSWLISFNAFCVGFAMFTASVPKIIRGWLNLDSHAVKAYMEHNAIFYEGIRARPVLYDPMMEFNSVFIWEALDYLTIIFEAGFLLAILWPRLFRVFVMVAVVFHLFIYLTFHITFTTNLLVYALYMNWSIFYPLARSEKFRNFFNLKNMYMALGATMLFTVIFLKDTGTFKGTSLFRQFIGLFVGDEKAKIYDVLALFVLALIIVA